MNVEVVQRRLWEQSQQHRKHMHQPQRIATVCDRVLKRSNNQDSLESRMLGNLHVRFGVGVGVQFPGPHHNRSTVGTPADNDVGLIGTSHVPQGGRITNIYVPTERVG